MTINEMVLKKHSALIQTNVKELTLTQRKLINFLMYIAQKAGDQRFYNTTISNIKEICNLPSTENLSVKDQLRDLSDIKIEFNYLNKDKTVTWAITALLASAKVTPNTGQVEYEFSNLLKDKILNPLMYAPLDVILISGLRSSYSIVLYEFLRDYLTSPLVPKLMIAEVRELMGIGESEYKVFSNFKVRVLDVAVNEVNNKTDIKCKYELFKDKGVGNKYSHIQFQVFKNENYGTEETLELKFENLENELLKRIPQQIIGVIPEKYRTNAITELITKYLNKGSEYVISNIKYALKKSSTNFSAYLKQALENDYASNDREVAAKSREAATKKHRQAEQEEKAKQTAYNDNAEILKLIEHMKPDKLKEVQNKFKEIVKTSGIKKEFLTESVKDSLMIEAYRALNKEDGYNAKDQD